MTDRPTDHRHLDFAQFHLDVCFGRAGGKVIWQPRIGAWLTDKDFAGEPYPEPYTGMTKPEIYRHLGVSDRLYDYNDCYVAVEDERVTHTVRELSTGEHEHTIETPVGKQVSVSRPNKENVWHTRVKHIISGPDEMKVAAWRARHTNWRFDHERFAQHQAALGDLGAPTAFMPRPNIQDLYINTMGVEQAIYALFDYTDVCEDYFDALNESHDRLMDVVIDSPIHIINFGDNVHAGTLPPDLFEKYLLPEYQKRSEKLRGGGKFVHAHWDGDVKPLLPYARDTGLNGIEAITPVPQGDVTLEETKAALGDEMFLLDGIPAIYFDETYPEQTLIDCAKRVIDLFAPNLVLGISEEISSHGEIERIRLVTEVVDDYNAGLTS